MVPTNISAISKKHIGKEKFAIILLWFTCPILSIPFLISESFKSNRIFQLLLAFTLGLIAMLGVPPQSDLYRHAQDFYSIKNLDWNDFALYLKYTFNIDFLLPFIELLYTKLGLSFGWIRLSLIFIAYILFFDLYNKAKSRLPKTMSLQFFITVLFILPFSTISTGLRFGFAESLLCYVIIKRCLLGIKHWPDIILVIISIYFHAGCLMFLCCIFISYLFPNNLKKSIFLIMFCICLIISTGFSSIITYLPFNDLLLSHIIEYTEGKYATNEYLSHMNFFGLLTSYVNICMFWIFMILFVKSKINCSNKIVFTTILLFAMTFSLYSLNGRVRSFLLILLPFYLAVNANYLKLVCRALICVAIINVVIQWRAFTVSTAFYLFTPIPIAIYHDYDERWINENVHPDGGLKIYHR